MTHLERTHLESTHLENLESGAGLCARRVQLSASGGGQGRPPHSWARSSA